MEDEVTLECVVGRWWELTHIEFSRGLIVEQLLETMMETMTKMEEKMTKMVTKGDLAKMATVEEVKDVELKEMETRMANLEEKKKSESEPRVSSTNEVAQEPKPCKYSCLQLSFLVAV